MARVTSNLPEIQASLQALGQTFALDRPTHGQSLGRDALAVVTTAIGDRCRAEEAPGGAEWPENKPWADRDPAKRGKPVGVLTGEMLSPEQLAGEPTITRESATTVYGTDEASRQKAAWFSEGNDNQPARPFYEMDETTDKALEAFLDAEVDRYLDSL